MRLLTRKRSCFNFVCHRQIHVRMCHDRYQDCVCCPSRVSVLPVPTIPQCTVHERQLPFDPSGEVILIFLIPNINVFLLLLFPLSNFSWIPRKFHDFVLKCLTINYSALQDYIVCPFVVNPRHNSIFSSRFALLEDELINV